VLILLSPPSLRQILNLFPIRRMPMSRIISRKQRIDLRRFARPIGSALAMLLLSSPAFAQFGGDRVTSFLSSALSYAQGLGIFGAGFLVIWAVANIARERPSGKQWAGAGGALLLSSVLQLLRTFAG
jgi:hypothetical protein